MTLYLIALYSFTMFEGELTDRTQCISFNSQISFLSTDLNRVSYLTLLSIILLAFWRWDTGGKIVNVKTGMARGLILFMHYVLCDFVYSLTWNLCNIQVVFNVPESRPVTAPAQVMHHSPVVSMDTLFPWKPNITVTSDTKLFCL